MSFMSYFDLLIFALNTLIEIPLFIAIIKEYNRNILECIWDVVTQTQENFDLRRF